MSSTEQREYRFEKTHLSGPDTGDANACGAHGMVSTPVINRRRAASKAVWSAVIACAWLAAALPSRAVAADARTAITAFALWSDQGVFLSEARQGTALLARRYGAVATVLRSNSRTRLGAGPPDMIAAIAEAGKGLDPERDVLFVFLSSHGSPEGIAEKGGRLEGLLSPAALDAVLKTSRVRKKVLIVSACFSGIFTGLAGPDLLVITAADATHPSFGCTATATWTYFGEAFFNEALRQATGAAGLDQVFGRAAALVRARETREGFEPSNPQLAGGANVLEALATAQFR